MSRPQTKTDIYEAIAFERAKLTEALEKLTDEQMELPGACGEWSVKDILSHLVDWEQRGLGWYRAGLRGEVPKTPDDNYNWRQLPSLNQAIYERCKDLSLAEVRQKFKASFEEMMAVIDGMTEEELFTPRAYKWTGNGLLRDFIDANTAAHYRWATKLIRTFQRSLGTSQD
jgi:uncharacterized protein (TIGR03083 family)